MNYLFALLCALSSYWNEDSIAKHFDYCSQFTRTTEVELNRKQFQTCVVEPTLKKLGLHTDNAVKLLVMIAAHESNKGEYIIQLTGQAKGLYQMEDSTHDFILQWVYGNKPELYKEIVKMADGEPSAMKMVTDMDYATAMARAFFLRFPEQLPDTEDEMAVYAKKRWNTYAGKATSNDYLLAYKGWK